MGETMVKPDRADGAWPGLAGTHLHHKTLTKIERPDKSLQVPTVQRQRDGSR